MFTTFLLISQLAVQDYISRPENLLIKLTLPFYQELSRLGVSVFAHSLARLLAHSQQEKKLRWIDKLIDCLWSHYYRLISYSMPSCNHRRAFCFVSLSLRSLRWLPVPIKISISIIGFFSLARVVLHFYSLLVVVVVVQPGAYQTESSQGEIKLSVY